MSFVQILPLAFVMIAGPQIISAFFFATSKDWVRTSFVAFTLLLLGLPALTVAALGPRAKIALPKIRDWMNQNSWVVSEIVLVFFAVITINSLVGD